MVMSENKNKKQDRADKKKMTTERKEKQRETYLTRRFAMLNNEDICIAQKPTRRRMARGRDRHEGSRGSRNRK